MKDYLKQFNSEVPFRAVCIGDATTAQDWCHPNWIDWLNFTFRETDNWQEAWRRKFINCGRDGATVKHYINSFESEIAVFKPHLVIMSVGINALLPKLDKEKYKSMLEKLVKKIMKVCNSIVVWSPYAFVNKLYHDDLQVISGINRSVCSEFNLLFIDMFTEFLKYDLKKLFTYKMSGGNKVWGIKENDIDFLHCNELGNQIIATRIAKEAFESDLSDWEYGSMKLKDLSRIKLHS